MVKKLHIGHYILGGIRAFLIVLLLLICLLFFLPSEPFVRNKTNYARLWRRFYCRIALWILGSQVKIDYESFPLPDHYLLVSNHLSFSDPLITLAFLDGMPVAKAEIRKYPIIGYAALKTGIIYVKREEKNSRKEARKAINQALESGRSVLVYPEGTISPEPQNLHPFRTGVFHSAIQSDAPIISMVIKYKNENSFWIPGRSILSQFFHQFGVWKQEVIIKTSKPMEIQKPKIAAAQSQLWIQNMLNSLL